MGDDKSSMIMASSRDSRDRELLIPVADSVHDGDASSKHASSASSSHHSGREPSFSVILFPIAVTFYITWWFIHLVDGIFSPIYAQLGINIFGCVLTVAPTSCPGIQSLAKDDVTPFVSKVMEVLEFHIPEIEWFVLLKTTESKQKENFGLGFVTSITFIFLVGVFMSSWLGTSVLGLGEWFIKRMPFVRHIYSASKQISAAISPDQNTQAFKEVAIIRHPRIGEYAFGFITSSVVLQSYSGDEELCCVYVPTNHLYIGDIFLVNSKEVIRPNLSVREGIEIVVSGGMSMPQILSTLDSSIIQVDRIGPVRS
ncbi:hypothetical protein TEA_010833 [Camellia sinensis var. sinensis]|uniref:Uncharacterized protein n=1 Tax=Camellia sinensis var. sinensis TaxID=542762 RepID=A0A4S4CZN2_CAMSN|nr:hypothetical protein TEA_010833 [Camellia sinensis var. sinensis]